MAETVAGLSHAVMGTPPGPWGAPSSAPTVPEGQSPQASSYPHPSPSLRVEGSGLKATRNIKSANGIVGSLMTTCQLTSMEECSVRVKEL